MISADREALWKDGEFVATQYLIRTGIYSKARELGIYSGEPGTFSTHISPPETGLYQIAATFHLGSPGEGEDFQGYGLDKITVYVPGNPNFIRDTFTDFYRVSCPSLGGRNRRGMSFFGTRLIITPGSSDRRPIIIDPDDPSTGPAFYHPKDTPAGYREKVTFDQLCDCAGINKNLALREHERILKDDKKWVWSAIENALKKPMLIVNNDLERLRTIHEEKPDFMDIEKFEELTKKGKRFRLIPQTRPTTSQRSISSIPLTDEEIAASYDYDEDEDLSSDRLSADLAHGDVSYYSEVGYGIDEDGHQVDYPYGDD